MAAPELERAKLYEVTGSLDSPIEELKEGQTPFTVQFNPVTLKVSLANSLKENERDGNSRAAQFIEKSSSNLTVELIFDTSDSYRLVDSEESGQENEQVPKITDVRTLVGEIATRFMHSPDVGDDEAEPKRCLFAWGAFAFVGIMESLEETIDFFAPEGIPLRATVGLKLVESRFQFHSEDVEAAKRDTPSLSSPSSSVPQATQEQGRDESDWRDTAMYNGVEGPRELSGEGLSVPTSKASDALKNGASVGAGIQGGFSAGLGAGFSGGFGLGGGLSGGVSAGFGVSASAGISGGIGASADLSGGLNAGLSGGLSNSGGLGLNANTGIGAGIGGGIGSSLSGGITTQLNASIGGGLSASTNLTPPGFSFGASSSLGTSIPGAFSADFKAGGGIKAGSLINGGAALRAEGSHLNLSANASASASTNATGNSTGSASANASAAVGFD